jgi:hypothetical protein
MYHSPASMYEITQELLPQFVQHLAIEGHPSVMTISCNFRLRSQNLDVLSSEIIEKNLYKICMIYIKDTSNETSFI